MTLPEILWICASYLVGAIPFGIILTMGSGVDIRSQGSGNIGATNVSRLLGRKLGVLTLLLDIAKGFLPMFAAAHLLPPGPRRDMVVALSGAASVLGHMFPVYLGFKGGKGVATGLGVFLYLAPVGVLICLAVFVVSVALSGFVSVGSLLGSLSIIPSLWFMKEQPWEMGVAAIIVVMIWIKHHQNISRLLNGTEKSWRKKE